MSMPSVRLLERLKASEGFRARPYVCPAGRVTIGYGHNLEAHPAAIRRYDAALADQVRAGGMKGRALAERLRALGMVWDEGHAEEWLRADVRSVMDGLSARCPAYRHLVNLAAAAHAGRSESAEGTPESRAAETRAEVLIDMAFNMGVAGLLGFRNTLARVERDDYEGAASGMLASRWAGQVGRRAVELARQMRTGEWQEGTGSALPRSASEAGTTFPASESECRTGRAAERHGEMRTGEWQEGE